MGRKFKAIDKDAPAYELALFMRSFINKSGMTLRQISRHGHVAHSTLSQNSDGRFRSWNCTREWFRALYLAADEIGRPLPMPLDAALHEARHLWDDAQGRSRSGSLQRTTHREDNVANGGSDARLATPSRMRPATAASSDRFIRDHATRHNASAQSIQEQARQTSPVPLPADFASLLGMPAPRASESVLRGPRAPADLNLDSEAMRYPSPTHRETLAGALRDLVEESGDCPRCAPPARQAALDNPAIQAVLAGTAPATAQDIRRIVVACGGTSRTVRTWERIIRALTDL